MGKHHSALPVPLFFLIAVVAVIPAAYREIVVGHDILFHVNWHRSFLEQLGAGEWYPRWLMDMNGGRGSPAFFFYPPLPYYASALVSLLMPTGTPDSLVLLSASVLALGLSGWTSYALLQHFSGRRTAFFCAVFYMLAPYHLMVDLYYRFAYAEFWALTWLPLLFNALMGFLVGRRQAAVWLVVGFALLVLTHLPSVLIVSPFLFLGILCNSPTFKKSVEVIALLAAGFLATAYYVLPMVFYQKFVSLDTMWSGQLAHAKNFVDAADTSFHRFFFSLAVLSLLMLLCLCLHLYSVRKIVALRFWLLAAALSLFLMFEVSAFLWRVLPPLQIIQFPWRLNMITLLATVVLMAVVFDNLKPVRLKTHLIAQGAFLGLVAAQFFLMVVCLETRRAERLSVEVMTEFALKTMHRPEVQEYLPVWLPDSSRTLDARLKQDPDRDLVKADAGGSVRLVERTPRRLSFDYEADVAQTVTVRQYYFPPMKLLVDGRAEIGGVSPDTEGYVRFVVPPGRHRLELVRGEGGAEVFGRWLSLGVLLLMTAVWSCHRPARLTDVAR